MTHRRVARKLVKYARKRLSPSLASQSENYSTDADIPDYNSDKLSLGGANVSTSEMERCARDEMPGNLSDLLMRRLGLGWEPDQGLALARSVAQAAAPHLGWSEGRVEDELLAYETHLNTARRKPGT